MIGDAALREIVGADLCGAVARADHRAARGRFRIVRLRGIELEEAALEHAHCLFAVLYLAALILALHDEPRWDVGDPYRGRGLVDVLAARAAGAVGIHPYIIWVYHDLHVLRLGKHGDGRRARVDAPLGFRFGHALDAVDAAFEFHAGIGVFAVYLENGLLHAAYLGIVHVDHLELEIMPFGVTGIHAEKGRAEERRLIPAYARADLDYDVALVVRILGEEHELQFFLERSGVFLRLPQLLAGQLAKLVIV